MNTTRKWPWKTNQKLQWKEMKLHMCWLRQAGFVHFIRDLSYAWAIERDTREFHLMRAEYFRKWLQNKWRLFLQCSFLTSFSVISCCGSKVTNTVNKVNDRPISWQFWAIFTHVIESSLGAIVTTECDIPLKIPFLCKNIASLILLVFVI